MKFEILEFYDSKIYGNKNIGISGFRDSTISGYSDFGMNEF